jgi:putative FmdB family regulatory protein
MPLYEYQCDACGHRFEKIQKFSDPLESICPVCGGIVRKLVSSPAFQFKGSGFYITDYPKKDQGGTDKSDGGSADTAAKSDSSSSKTDKSDKGDKSDKSTTPAASDKSTSASSNSSSSGSKESSSASSSTPKSGKKGAPRA